MQPLLAGNDSANGRFKKFLPAAFFSAAIFFEIRKESENDQAAFNLFAPEALSRAWPPQALILRGEGLIPEYAGTIRLASSGKKPPQSFRASPELLIGGLAIMSTFKLISSNYYCALLNWSQNEFSDFAFNLLARLSGTYNGRRSTMYAMSWIDSTNATKEES